MKRALLMIGGLLCTVIAAGTLWFAWLVRATSREENAMIAAEAWAERVRPVLQRIDGVGEITIGAPRRYSSFAPPDWFLSVSGVVLDPATEKRVHEAFNAAGPPCPGKVRWGVADCAGDRAYIARVRAEAQKDAGR